MDSKAPAWNRVKFVCVRARRGLSDNREPHIAITSNERQPIPAAVRLLRRRRCCTATAPVVPSRRPAVFHAPLCAKPIMRAPICDTAKISFAFCAADSRLRPAPAPCTRGPVPAPCTPAPAPCASHPRLRPAPVPAPRACAQRPRPRLCLRPASAPTPAPSARARACACAPRPRPRLRPRPHLCPGARVRLLLYLCASISPVPARLFARQKMACPLDYPARLGYNTFIEYKREV